MSICVWPTLVDVDLYVTADLKCMTSIYMGHQKLEAAMAKDEVNLTGDKALTSSINNWLGLSPLAYV